MSVVIFLFSEVVTLRTNPQSHVELAQIRWTFPMEANKGLYRKAYWLAISFTMSIPFRLLSCNNKSGFNCSKRNGQTVDQYEGPSVPVYDIVDCCFSKLIDTLAILPKTYLRNKKLTNSLSRASTA